MKKIKSFAALALALIMILLSFAGCGGGNGKMDDSERGKLIAKESKTVTMLIPGYDGKDENSYYTKAIKEFEQKYGKKVELLQAVGDQLASQKVAAQIMAKDPIDVFVLTVDQYLGMYQKNYLLPVDDYVNLDGIGHNKSVMDSFVKFDGKYYAAGVSATPYVLYYNRDILEAAGFDPDEPKKLYEKGEWDWKAFVEIARECNDTASGVVGLENMFDEVFQASNNCVAVQFKDGKYALNIKTAEMRHTLEMVQDIFNKNIVCGNGYVTGQNKFLKGKAAMHGAYAYEEATFNSLKKAGSVNIDFGVTAFPIGPDNSDKKNFGHSTGYGISNGSDAPYSAGALIDLILKYADEDNKEKEKNEDPENRKLYNELSKNLCIPSYTDGILEQGFGAFYLLYDVRNGEDINQKLAQYETTYQKMVDDANALLK